MDGFYSGYIDCECVIYLLSLTGSYQLEGRQMPTGSKVTLVLGEKDLLLEASGVEREKVW
jgi:hypothetical protein